MDFNGISMTTKAKILVLFANAYNITEEGKNVQGCTVHYLFWGEAGEFLLTQSELNADKPVGVQRAKCSLDMELRNKIPLAPAVYEGSFEMKVGGDGKPVMKLVDVAYVSNVEMKEKVINGLEVPGMVERLEKSK